MAVFVGIALALTMMPTHSARAAQDATLTLLVQYESGGKTKAIDGASFEAIRIASLDDAVNFYELREEYASLNVDFNKGLTAAQMEEAAVAAAKIASSNGEAGVSATSTKDGTASFGTLPYGVYLVIQTGSDGTAKQYETSKPFLVSVPQITEEGVTFDVTCLPKMSPRPPEPPAPPRMPKTSDLLQKDVLISCLGSGIVLAAAGALMRRKKTTDDTEA